MRKILSLFALLVAFTVNAQLPSTIPLRGDSIIISKVGGSAELVIRNRTKDSLGFLFNIGNGRTQFRRAKQMNDSTLVFGVDTFHVKGGSAFDSTNTQFRTYLVDHPGTIKVDVTGILRVGGVRGDSLYNIPVSTGPSTASFVNIAAMRAATPPTDSTVVMALNYYNNNDYVVTEWQYFASSTTTVDNSTVYAPTSGVGRYKYVIRNNRATFKQLNVFPAADNTTAYFAAAAFINSAGAAAIHPKNTTYTLAPTAANNMYDYMTILGEDSATSIIQVKSYATQNKDVFHYYDLADTLVGVSISGIKFKGGVSYTNHAISAGPVDTASTFIYVNLGKKLNFIGNSYEDGGTKAAIYLFDVHTAYVTNSTFKNIGGMGISTVYAVPNEDVWVTDNIGWSWGMRDRYDGGAPPGYAKVRFGDDFYECGGTRNHVNRNRLWNKAKTRWFWIEARMFGYNEAIGNEIHGEGMNSMGFSWGNPPTFPLSGPWAVNNRVQGNIQDSIYYDTHTAADSIGGLPKYIASNLWEFGGTEGLQFTGNNLMSPHMTVSRHNTGIYSQNIINSPNSNTTTESGAAILWNIGTNGGDTSAIRNMVIRDQVKMHDGELVRLTNNGNPIIGLDVNMQATWDGDMILGEVYPATGGVRPLGFSMNGTYNGTVYRAFYTGNSGSAINFSISGANLRGTNIDYASNLIDFGGLTAPVIDKELATFSTTGQYTSHVKTVNSTAPDAAGDVVVPGGTVALGNVPVFGVVAPPDSTKIQKNLGWFDFRSYSTIAPDGKMLYDGAMTAGSTTFTSASAVFTSGDIGKVIHPKGVGASSKDSTGTITAFTNSTTVTLSFAASTTVSSAQFVYGTDLTLPVQATINAATASGHGVAYFPDGIYIINGALQTSISGQNPNSQLYIPLVAAGNLPVHTSDRTLTIQGGSPASVEEGALTAVNPVTIGTIFYSTLNTSSGTYPCILGTKGESDGAGGFFNAVDVNMQNIIFRNTAGKNSGGPRMSGVNFEWAVNTNVHESRFDIDIPGSTSSSPTFLTFGYKGTKTNGGIGVVTNNVFSVGHKYGFVFGEWATGNNIQTTMNEYGIGFTATNHAIHLQSVPAQWNKHAIGMFSPEAGNCVLKIDKLDVELRTDGSWYDNSNTIDDPSSNLNGYIHYYKLETFGALFSQNGASAVTLIDLTRGNLARHQVTGTAGTVTYLPGQNDSTAVAEVRSGYVASDDSYFPQFLVTNDQTGTSNAVGQFMFVNNSASTQKRLVQMYAATDGNINKGRLEVRASDGSSIPTIFNFNSDSFRLFRPLVPSRWTTSTRPASPTTGMIGFNNDSGRVDVRVGAAWKQLANTSDIVSGGGSGTPGGSTTQVQYNNAGAFAGSANFIWDNTNARLGIGGAPSAPLHIVAPSVSGYGQFSVQAATGTAGSSLAYMSWRDGSGSRMMVEGFGQYGGSPDLNYYYANEINGSYIWRNSSVQIAELTTDGKLGLGITPTERLHVYNAGSSSKLLIESNNISALAGTDFKVGGTTIGAIRGIGSSGGAGVFSDNALSVAGYAGNLVLSTTTSGAAISMTTNNGTDVERLRIEGTGDVKLFGTRLGVGTPNILVKLPDSSIAQMPYPTGGGSGTVTSFGKSDGFGITSSVANSTTTPVHTVAIDSAAVFSAYAGRLVRFTGSTDYTISQGIGTLCYLYSSGGTTRVITLPNPSTVPNREIKVYIAGTSIAVGFATVGGTANFYNNTGLIGTTLGTNTSALFTFKSDGTDWTVIITN